MEINGVGPAQEHGTRTMARHLTVLDSLRCTVCGAGVGTTCDIVAHQVWGVATFACSSCGASIGDPCAPSCRPDRVLTTLLNGPLAG